MLDRNVSARLLCEIGWILSKNAHHDLLHSIFSLFREVCKLNLPTPERTLWNWKVSCFSSQQKIQYVAIIWESERSSTSWPSIMIALFILFILIIMVTINLITCAQAPPCETMMFGKVGDLRLPQKCNRRLRRRPNRLFARCRLWKGSVKEEMTLKTETDDVRSTCRVCASCGKSFQ